MVKLNKIYTRTGDEGSTGLVDGSRVSKADARMAAIGDVDEANCAIGMALAVVPDAYRPMLARVQNEMFDLGADLATPGEDFTPGEMTLRMTAAQVATIMSTTRLRGNADMRYESTNTLCTRAARPSNTISGSASA